MEENYKDIFKRNFDHHEDEIDPQIIWDNVKPKKKTKKFFWFMISSILLIVVASLSFLYFKADQDGVVGRDIQSSESESLQKVEEVVSKEVAKEVSSGQNIYKDKSNLINKKVGQGQESSPRIAEPTFTEVKQKDNKQKYPSTESSIKAEIVNTELETKINSSDEFQLKTGNDSPVQNTALEPGTIGDEKILINALSILEIAEIEVASREVPALWIDLDEVQSDKSEGAPENATKHKLSLAVNAGYGFLSAKRTANEQGNSDLLLSRTSTVSELEAARVNMLVNYHLGSKISLSSGVQFSRLNELFEWKGNYKRTTNGQYISEIIETPEATYFSYEEGEHEENVERNMKIYNKTNLFSIPLIVNLHQSLGAFSFSISGGVEANVLQLRSGFVLDDLGIPLALEDQQKSEFGLSYLGKFGIEYELCKQLSVAASLGYIQMKHTESKLNSNYAIKDIGLGLRYNFGE